MDGTGDWPRTSPGGKPCVYLTRDGGETWKRCDEGFCPASTFKIPNSLIGLEHKAVAGTETAELAQLKKAYAAQEPLLFYFYNPQWKWANPEFADSVVPVELPAITP